MNSSIEALRFDVRRDNSTISAANPERCDVRLPRGEAVAVFGLKLSVVFERLSMIILNCKKWLSRVPSAGISAFATPGASEAL